MIFISIFQIYRNITSFLQGNKFIIHKIFITPENNSVFRMTSSLSRFFSRRQIECLKLLYLTVSWFSLFPWKFQINNDFYFNFSNLQKYLKMFFFSSLETTTSYYHIQNITLQENLVFLAVSNLKYKNYPN